MIMLRSASAAIGAAAITLCLVLPASADKLSDFKRAAGSRGCDAIPYSGSRSSCKGFQSNVNRYCKSSGSFSCDKLRTKGLINTNRQLQRKLNDLRRDRKKNASEIRRIEQTLRNNGQEINRRKRQCDANIRTGSSCHQHRQRVQTLFKNVKSTVNNERAPQLRGYKRTLISKYTAEERGHQVAIDSAKRAVQKCKDARSGNW